MPIRPENRGRYPDEWDDISRRIRFDRAQNRCECEGECGRGHASRCPRRQGDLLKMDPNGPKVILTVAHLDHTPENCDENNLRAMCQGCHLHYDRGHHAQTAARTRREQATRGMTPLFDQFPEVTR